MGKIKYLPQTYSAPQHTKVEAIADRQAYLAEKTKEWRAEYDVQMSVRGADDHRIVRIVLYITGFVLLVVAYFFMNVEKLRIFSYFFLAFGWIALMVALALTPRRRVEPTNPYQLKLVNPDTIELAETKRKGRLFYSFFFDYTENGELLTALTEKEYTGEEKDKIISSFQNGTLVCAVDKDDCLAYILEY